MDIYPSSIVSDEAFGTPDAIIILSPTGIVSGEAFGNNSNVGMAYGMITVVQLVNPIRIETTQEDFANVQYGVSMAVRLQTQQVNFAHVEYFVVVIRENVR